MVARQLPRDWTARYGLTPVLLVSFVEFECHTGTDYEAANRVNVRRTTGRGKTSKSNKPLMPIEDIWVYPLQRDWRSVLCWDGS